MIKEVTVFTPHAYAPSQPAVKSSQPHGACFFVSGCKGMKKYQHLQTFS